MRAMSHAHKTVSSSKMIYIARVAAICALLTTGIAEAIGVGNSSAELGTGLVVGAVVAAAIKAFHIV